ncbi:mucin-5AC-like isoform X4 [Triticum urartu]|uniref:Uncharacterized protein n=1 Tax=Triticum urartu TaxID=4572 RepID=A0A8R7TQY7_TRIUA|nr:mucin-5AC-like isoform X4 [Triticum urartu]
MHTQVKLVVTMKLSAEPSPSSSGYAGEQGSSVASSASIEEPYPAPGAMDSCATRSTPTRPRRWPWLGSFTIRSTSELISAPASTLTHPSSSPSMTTRTPQAPSASAAASTTTTSSSPTRASRGELI